MSGFDDAVRAAVVAEVERVEREEAERWLAEHPGPGRTVDTVLVFLFGCHFCGAYPGHRAGEQCPTAPGRHLGGLSGFVS